MPCTDTRHPMTRQSSPLGTRVLACACGARAELCTTEPEARPDIVCDLWLAQWTQRVTAQLVRDATP